MKLQEFAPSWIIQWLKSMNTYRIISQQHFAADLARERNSWSHSLTPFQTLMRKRRANIFNSHALPRTICDL